MFKPTREQILQAWEDRDEGRPLTKQMLQHLMNLDQLEQANTQAVEETKRAVQAALRAQLRLLEAEVSEMIEAALARRGSSGKIVLSDKDDALFRRFKELQNKVQ